MATAQGHPVCAVCSAGRSSDRPLLHCSNETCSSGAWFHSQCIGSAIVSLNFKKTQLRWLCPWCLLLKASSLSERQLLALTLQISHLESVRSHPSCSTINLIGDVSPTIDPTPGPSTGGRISPSNDTIAAVRGRTSSLRKRSITLQDDPAVPDGSCHDLSSTCAKCRRTYTFVGQPFFLLCDILFRSSSFA